MTFMLADPEKRAEAQREYEEVRRSLDCSNGSCPYAEVCASKGKESRYPAYAGGQGGCLRYYNRCEGLEGFYLPDGRPVILTDEAIAALKGVMKNETC